MTAGDLLGDCGLSPDMFYIMTKSLLDQAGADIPLVAVLEGGYNVSVSAECIENVALALLDEPCHNGQYYDLSRYWKGHKAAIDNHDNATSNKTKKKASKTRKRKTDAASRCIRESALALEEANKLVSPISMPTMAARSDGPLKKRKPQEDDMPFDYLVV